MPRDLKKCFSLLFKKKIIPIFVDRYNQLQWRKFSESCLLNYSQIPEHTHTHTHTYIYIYIYIERERERVRERMTI